MNAKFRILKLLEDGSIKVVHRTDLNCLSVGSFTFVVDDKNVPFDWRGFSCSEVQDGIFEYQSGYGYLFVDHYIDDVMEELLNESGLSRNDLSAPFLASASEINEFFVSIDDGEYEDISAGNKCDTPKSTSGYFLEMIEISFKDECHAEDMEFMVDSNVITAYNQSVKASMGIERNPTAYGQNSVEDNCIDLGKIFRSICDAMPNLPGNEYFWSDGSMILCCSEDRAKTIADFLEAMGCDPVTGYYEPKEDKQHQTIDLFTGWYYVDIN